MRFRTITVRLGAAGALAALALGLAAPPASAHAALESATPKRDARVESVNRITLTFTQPVTRPEIIVRDTAGKRLDPGRATAVDSTVTQALTRPLPNGAYNVGWRVVSQDGHPITGTYEFEVTGTPGQSAAAPTQEAASATAVAKAPAQDEGGGMSAWWWIGLAALAAALAGAGIAWARRATD